jgi:hypothetical protein
MRKQILPFLFIFLSFAAAGQKSLLKGTITDTIEHKSLQNSLVTLMRAGDSVLIKFTRVDKSGNFSIPDLEAGKFIIMITHPYHGDVFDSVVIEAGVTKELGQIVMTPKTKLLEEVIVKSGAPIRIKGDTTVYTADSFKVRPGANVEELLRRLPGIQVDRNGQITAMGERVKKVLVDGEEFFGSDPGIATKSLRADVVKEVEVYDKKSDQAEFTGIDDGVKDKTINLKLKEDKKKGYFGKIELGGGTDQRFNNSFMGNAFKGKRKLSAYAIMSNTGQTRLDWQEAQNYGGGMDGVETGVSDDGGMYMMMTSDNDDVNFRGGQNGIPTNWNGGLHYSNKFHDGKQTLNAGYRFSKINSPGVTQVFSRQFTQDTSWLSNSIDNKFTQRIRHQLNIIVENNLDSNNSIKWTTRANHYETKTSSDYSIESFRPNGDSLNSSYRESDNNNQNNGVKSSLLWRHKFKKKSRTLSVNADLNWSRVSNDQLLYARNNRYEKGLIERRDTLDQFTPSTGENQSLVAKIAYTEPLAKEMYLEINYALSLYNNINDRFVFTRDKTSGNHDDRVDSLSNSFTFKRVVNTPGANLRVNKKKYNWSVGASVAFSDFGQTSTRYIINEQEKTKANYDFINFFPRASFTYKIKPNEVIRFNYNGNTSAPSIEQLQPVRINNDPFNIYIGNPNLDQSFRHSFNLNYSFYNVLKDRSLWTGLDYSITQNAFVQFSTIDSNGARTFQTVNADGVYNLNFYSYYDMKLGDSKWRLSVGPDFSMNRYMDYVRDKESGNTVKNVTNTRSIGGFIEIGQYVNDKYDFRIGPRFNWNTSKASLNTTANAKYWQATLWGNGSYRFTKIKLSFGSEIEVNVRQKDPKFTQNNNFTMWTAYVAKEIFKEWELRFNVYDILNQNRGYQRNLNSYNFSETYYNTLRRYCQLMITWNFSKNGKPAGW